MTTALAVLAAVRAYFLTMAVLGSLRYTMRDREGHHEQHQRTGNETGHEADGKPLPWPCAVPCACGLRRKAR